MPSLKYPTSVSLSPEARKKLKAYGAPRGWSTSKMIEYICTDWLRWQAERDAREQKERGKKAALRQIK